MQKFMYMQLQPENSNEILVPLPNCTSFETISQSWGLKEAY